MKSTTGIVLLLIATIAYSAPQVHAEDCIADAEECEHGNDCCSGVCVFHDGLGHGLCQSEPDPSRVCLKLGTRCREDKACCSDYCSGICKDAPFRDRFGQPQICTGVGGSCSSDRRCCSRRCGLDSGSGRVCIARRS